MTLGGRCKKCGGHLLLPDLSDYSDALIVVKCQLCGRETRFPNHNRPPRTLKVKVMKI